MKTTKKIFTLILSLAILMSMSMSAFATDNVGNNGGTAGADVNATYVGGNDDEAYYSVDITWSDMSFTYNGGGRTWDPTTHSYITTDAGWEEGSGTITVTNHSNVAIEATPTYAAVSGFETANMKFYNEETEITSLEVASAEPVGDAQTGTAQTGIITVKPDGYLTASATGGKIGEIIVTISGVGVSDDTSGDTSDDTSDDTSGDTSDDTTGGTPGGDESGIVVNDASALSYVLNEGGTAKLGSDITLVDAAISVNVTDGVVATLDLNGHTLSSNWNPLNLSGGTLNIIDSVGTGKLTATDDYMQIIYVGWDAVLNIQGGTICSYNGVYNTGTTTISGGSMIVENYIVFNDGGSSSITGGTFTQDPSAHVDTQEYNVTDNGDGTYTVTKK